MTPEIPETRDYPVNTYVAGKLVHFPDLEAVKNSHRGWVAGPYIKGLEEVTFEVKQEVQKKGAERTEWAKPSPGTTFAMVLSGSTTISYLVDDKLKEITLTAGQSVLQSNEIPHKWVVNEDGTMIITMRTYHE